MKIILASKSGVRKNILDKYKIENEVIVSHVDENEIKDSLLAEGANPLEVSKNLAEIKSIKMDVKEGLNPKRQLLLCLKDNREIPLTGTEQQIGIETLEQLEEYAITIAKYLNVFLERA